MPATLLALLVMLGEPEGVETAPGPAVSGETEPDRAEWMRLYRRNRRGMGAAWGLMGAGTILVVMPWTTGPRWENGGFVASMTGVGVFNAGAIVMSVFGGLQTSLRTRPETPPDMRTWPNVPWSVRNRRLKGATATGIALFGAGLGLIAVPWIAIVVQNRRCERAHPGDIDACSNEAYGAIGLISAGSVVTSAGIVLGTTAGVEWARHQKLRPGSARFQLSPTAGGLTLRF